MKNLRMYVSAFAVLAIVSSALAFKAKPVPGNLYCLVGSNPAVCTQEALQTTVNGAPVTNPCGAGQSIYSDNNCQTVYSEAVYNTVGGY